MCTYNFFSERTWSYSGWWGRRYRYGNRNYRRYNRYHRPSYGYYYNHGMHVIHNYEQNEERPVYIFDLLTNFYEKIPFI